MDSNGPVGYNPKIVPDGADPKFLCSRCKFILRDPKQSFCGHRFCSNCFDHLIENNVEICPSCEAEGNADCDDSKLNPSEAFPDNAIKRDLKRLSVKCVNNGCDWEGKFSQYEEHINQCPRAPIPCERCGNLVARDQMNRHQDPTHGDCAGYRSPCRYECGEHLRQGQEEEHDREYVCKHLELVAAKLMLLQENFGNQITPSTNAHLQELGEKISLLERHTQTQDQNLNQLLEKLNAATSSGQFASGRSEASATASLSMDPKVVEELDRRIKIVDSKFITFEGIVAVLNREIESTSAQMETYDRQNQQQKDQIDQLDNKVRTLERTLALKEIQLTEQAKRIEDLELTSYDGVLIWKVPEVAAKRQEARTGKTPSVYSPPFYTGKKGYKMCARAYLNGDGMGKDTHLSLFFVIHRHHYDALIQWPFRQRVTIMLLDQSGRDHVMDAFRPDPTSSSFKRPVTEMNIASGCPMFMPLSQLDDRPGTYIKDDTMFFKIIVDTSDLNRD